ncbi:MAG: rRNA adenine dimethyltransferase family protein, partial [Bacteroidota bacterium]
AGRLHVVGNLPYYITSPILFSLFDAFEHIERAVLMMQLEVAERLVAEPRTKAYGILSVVTQLYTQPSVLFRVSRHVFYPKPDVTSAVVALAFDPEPAWASKVDPAWLRRVIRQAFNMRRKTLRNSLKPLGRAVPEAFSRRRAEELTPGEFVELAALLV